jgi:hypothetical protein
MSSMSGAYYITSTRSIDTPRWQCSRGSNKKDPDSEAGGEGNDRSMRETDPPIGALRDIGRYL